MLKLYYAEIDGLSTDLINRDFSAYRKARIAAQKAEQKKQQSIAAELLLIELVRDLVPDFSGPLDVDIGEKGKPFLRDGPYSFSVSHSGNLAACALSDHEIGLDIETARIYQEGLVSRFFSPEEAFFLQTAGDRDDEFTKLWTLKESYLKACGSGLSKALNSFTIQYDREGRALALGEYRFFHCCREGFHFALCVSGANVELSPNDLQKKKLL